MTNNTAMVRLSQRAAPKANIDLAGRRIGLALGGGGARGIAHIAVLEVLDELGLRPDAIAGTSIGAIYGAAYASGFSAAHLRAVTEDTLGNRWGMIRQLYTARSAPTGRLLRLFPQRSALLDAASVLDLVLPSGMAKRFEDLAIPLQLTATSLNTHEPVTFARGDLRTAIAASMAIPVVFSPVARDGALHLDGGLTNPCPFDLLMETCDIVVAIDVSGAPTEGAMPQNPTALTVAVQTAQIIQRSVTRERLRYQTPDIFFEFGIEQFGAFDFHRAKEILSAVESTKPRLKALLSRVISSETVDNELRGA